MNFAKKILLALLAISAAAFSFAQTQGNPLSAVVKITTISCQPDFFSPWRNLAQSGDSGSGVVISGNAILTNAHNITDATYISVERDQNGEPFAAKVKAVNHQCDLALLEVEDESFFEGITPFEIGETPPAQTQVFAAGYPMGGDGISVTQGIISRIEDIVYVQYPYFKHIAAQLDAAINPGNSGGPVLLDGKIVGIAFQGTDSGEGLGYMIHTDIIKHFLNEVKLGEIRGFGRLCVSTQPLQSADARRFLKMKKGHSGVLVSKVFSNTDKNIKQGDVILEIDGFKVFNNGNVLNERGESVNFSTITDRKRLGDAVKLKLLRDGKEISTTAKLALKNNKILPHCYSEAPKYMLAGGFVFTNLSLSYMEQANDVPPEFSMMLPQENADADEKTIIISQTLGDSSTEGYKNVSGAILKSVNGKKVKNLKELAKIYDEQKEGFIIFECSGDRKIIADINSLKSSMPRIMKSYNISSDRNL